MRKAGQPLAQPAGDPVDALGPHRGEPGLAVEVDEAEPLVADLEPGPPGPLSQVPQVIPVKAFKLIGDVDAPPAPALDPGPVRMAPGDDLDERRASRARMPAGVGQAQHLTKAHAGLRQRGESRRSRSDPDHSPLAASRAALADKIAATCAGVSSGQASRRLRRTGIGLRRLALERPSRWARNAR